MAAQAVIPAPRKLNQDSFNSKVSLGYTTRQRSAQATFLDPICLKKKKKTSILGKCSTTDLHSSLRQLVPEGADLIKGIIYWWVTVGMDSCEVEKLWEVRTGWKKWFDGVMPWKGTSWTLPVVRASFHQDMNSFRLSFRLPHSPAVLMFPSAPQQQIKLPLVWTFEIMSQMNGSSPMWIFLGVCQVMKC